MTEKIKSLGVFEGFEDSEVASLLEGAEEKLLKHRATLFKADTDAHFFALVLEGAVKLVKPSPSGDDVIVLFALPGDVIGALIMVQDKSTYPVSVIALGETVVLKIPRRTFQESWQKNQIAMRRVNALIYSRMTDFHDQKSMTKTPLPRKIARQIVSLIDRYGTDAGTILPIPLTRQEIADAVGSTVESVIRVMSSWSQLGIIRTSGQHIEILKMDKVLEILSGKLEA
ncbi:MAG: Crp/Fnr family transcriptional regulator [Bdellovibrionales bacterium]